VVGGSSSRRPHQGRRDIALLVVVVGGVIGATVVLNALGSPGASVTAPSCVRSDPQVADSEAPHGLFVLTPPTGPNAANGEYQGGIAADLLNNPAVCGADFQVHWNSIDQGPGANPQYNFSKTDAEIAPWLEAGKEVNLIVQMVGYGPNASYVPAYALEGVPTFHCGESSVTPAFWTPSYETAYRGFVAAFLHHYEVVPGIGYLRFGLGTGGETFPVLNSTAPGCASQLDAADFSIPLWNNYLTGMLSFERSLHPTVQLMVALNSVFSGTPDNVTTTVAAAAVADGIGIGSEGLEASNYAKVTPSGVGCGGFGWCQQFEEHAGQVPLELQPYGPSSPNGSGPVGSLVPLLSFSLTQHAQIFEVYFVDWLIAFDPGYPGYATWHVAYANALESAAGVVGEGAV
jgi:hypothetical protein